MPKYIILITLIFIFIILLILYMKYYKIENFNGQNGLYCPRCDGLTFGRCIKCINCGFCGDKGSGNCVEGSFVGPKNKIMQNICPRWYTNDIFWRYLHSNGADKCLDYAFDNTDLGKHDLADQYSLNITNQHDNKDGYVDNTNYSFKKFNENSDLGSCLGYSFNNNEMYNPAIRPPSYSYP